MRKATLPDLGGVVFQSTGISNQKIDWNIISQLNYKYGHDLNIGKDMLPQFFSEYNQLTNQQLKKDDFLKNSYKNVYIRY